MPTKLAFNPTTGQLDLVQNLSAYAKLAISITSAELYALVAAGTIVPRQWYLITDYQTVDYIRNSEKTTGGEGFYEFYTAPVERIYLRAKTTNTLYKEKVEVVKTISVKGIKHAPGAVIELQGDDLITAKRLGKVKTYVEVPADSLQQTPTLETIVIPEEQKKKIQESAKKLQESNLKLQKAAFLAKKSKRRLQLFQEIKKDLPKILEAIPTAKED
jgi:hypothetical protein